MPFLVNFSPWKSLAWASAAVFSPPGQHAKPPSQRLPRCHDESCGMFHRGTHWRTASPSSMPSENASMRRCRESPTEIRNIPSIPRNIQLSKLNKKGWMMMDAFLEVNHIQVGTQKFLKHTIANICIWQYVLFSLPFKPFLLCLSSLSTLSTWQAVAIVHSDRLIGYVSLLQAGTCNLFSSHSADIHRPLPKQRAFEKHWKGCRQTGCCEAIAGALGSIGFLGRGWEAFQHK